jgi:putative pyruvate formate lyase activating enzyme
MYFYSAMPRTPSYLFLTERDWNKRIDDAILRATSCELCPRRCKVNRMNGEKGFCMAPGELVVSSVFAHFGEEPPLSGTHGSGTVFFSYCTLQCCFCQNYQISHQAQGQVIAPRDLAQKCLQLQEQGCHNINLVTATHFLPWLLIALKEASEMGLALPIIYNNGGYELPETIELLKDIVDVYLPDMKYGGSEEAKRYSRAADYVEINQKAVKAMFRQVGPLSIDKNGIAYRGMCIRHLVLPSGRARSDDILEFLLRSFDPQDISISLMAQYRPLFKAADFPEIDKALASADYEPMRLKFEQSDIGGFYQELPGCDDRFCIDFAKRKSEPLRGE